MAVLQFDRDLIFHEIDKQGRLRLSFLFDRATLEDEMWEAFEDWASDKPEFKIVSLNFELKSVLDSILEGSEMLSNPGTYEAEAAPIVNAIRSELVKMIERIDSLKFESA